MWKWLPHCDDFSSAFVSARVNRASQSRLSDVTGILVDLSLLAVLSCQPSSPQDGHCGKYLVIILEIVCHYSFPPVTVEARLNPRLCLVSVVVRGRRESDDTRSHDDVYFDSHSAMCSRDRWFQNWWIIINRELISCLALVMWSGRPSSVSWMSIQMMLQPLRCCECNFVIFTSWLDVETESLDLVGLVTSRLI